MHIDKIEATRGVRVKVGDKLHTAEFTYRVAGVGGDIDAAEKRAAELAEKAAGDWLSRIYEEQRGSPKERQPSSRMVELVFDATNSRHRSDRILRATSEEMTFEPDPRGDGWICIDHNGRQFHMDADKDAGLGRCDCEDFVNRGIRSKMPCKHIYALAMSSDGFWEDPEQSDRKV